MGASGGLDSGARCPRHLGGWPGGGALGGGYFRTSLRGDPGGWIRVVGGAAQGGGILKVGILGPRGVDSACRWTFHGGGDYYGVRCN